MILDTAEKALPMMANIGSVILSILLRKVAMMKPPMTETKLPKEMKLPYAVPSQLSLMRTKLYSFGSSPKDGPTVRK